MVGILDVLHHQFPIPRNALTRIALDDERPAVEGTVEVMQEVGADVFLQWLDLLVERCKHHSTACSYLQLCEASIIQGEIGRHSALPLDPALEWHANELAVKVVIPLVIGTHQSFHLAVALLTEAHRPVRAPIL